mmetsp:Transcript_27694/g.34418  ORF Transcript_27694/g.34418 Transcript_27694/m.34418 type:complete len:82 (-) Transcript_27694:3068-3313(-)
MAEISENYVSEYTPLAHGRHSFQPNSSLQEHSDDRSRREGTPLEFHSSMHVDTLQAFHQGMNSMRGGRDESPPLSKDQQTK